MSFALITIIGRNPILNNVNEGKTHNFRFQVAVFLRVDLFLKLMGVTKTRMAAKRLCDTGKVLLGGKRLKPSHELEGGESLDVLLPLKELKLRILGIPDGKSVAKPDRAKFLQIESARAPLS